MHSLKSDWFVIEMHFSCVSMTNKRWWSELNLTIKFDTEMCLGAEIV